MLIKGVGTKGCPQLSKARVGREGADSQGMPGSVCVGAVA